MGDRPKHFPIELKDSFFILEIEWGDELCQYKERFIDNNVDQLYSIVALYKASATVAVTNYKILEYKIARL